MAPLKQFVFDSYFFPVIIEYFVLIDIHQLDYDYCCVVALLVSFGVISFVLVQKSYQHVKCHLDDIDIAFSEISFSCSILTTISIFFLSFSLGIFVCNTIKILLFSRLRMIKGVFVSIFFFTFFVSFFFHDS